MTAKRAWLDGAIQDATDSTLTLPSPPPETTAEGSLPRGIRDHHLGPAFDLKTVQCSSLPSPPAASPNEPRISMYVEAFEEMLATVLDREAHLFNDRELGIVKDYRALPYESRFLFVRLFMRKRKAWFRIEQLGYFNDIGNMQTAVSQLLHHPMQGSSAFAIDASVLTVKEVLELLSLDELKDLAKKLQVKSPGTTRQSLTAAMMAQTSSQSTLSCSLWTHISPKSKKSRKSLTLDYEACGSRRKQTSMLQSRAIAILGQAIKLDDAVVDVFSRIHVVFYRSIVYDEKSMVTAILARISKRNFPSYVVSRSDAFFANREDLTEYTDALMLQATMEAKLEENTTQSLAEGLKIFDSIYGRWREIIQEMKDVGVNCETESPLQSQNYYRRRFTAGWIYTRLLYKGAYILSRFQEYEREMEVLRHLLAQRVFKVGKRGAWYERLALILMNHVEAKDPALKESFRLCEEALEDSATHTVYRPALQRRIIRLGKMLDRPVLQPRFLNLRAATKVQLWGERVSDRETGKKAIYRHRDGHGCSVEELCLAWYEGQSGGEWKGFHSENGIMTTIFALIFWDVLFAPVEGAFETHYQSAPLDLATDAFSIIRARPIAERISDITEGRAVEILSRHDALERPRQTWAAGVKWDYSLEEMIEIVTCLGHHALSVICRMYAEEWGHRTGGLPDLCLWKPEIRQCKFVEVKGPGDRLSETQRVWIDVLINSGVAVELCAVESDDRKKDTGIWLSAYV